MVYYVIDDVIENSIFGTFSANVSKRTFACLFWPSFWLKKVEGQVVSDNYVPLPAFPSQFCTFSYVCFRVCQKHFFKSLKNIIECGEHGPCYTDSQFVKWLTFFSIQLVATIPQNSWLIRPQDIFKLTSKRPPLMETIVSLALKISISMSWDLIIRGWINDLHNFPIRTLCVAYWSRFSMLAKWRSYQSKGVG